tara:strand:+ start:121 stop:507 length:387 start_codon:yes stop_codon:yes gene_type:complete
MARQPLAKGRVAYVAETYQSNELDQNRQPKEKNRYANLGRATAWPAENGATMPQISIDLDALPVGMSGSTKLFIFWDDANQQQGYDNQKYQPAPQQAYQAAPPQAAPERFGSWDNQPQQPAPQPNGRR